MIAYYDGFVITEHICIQTKLFRVSSNNQMYISHPLRDSNYVKQKNTIKWVPIWNFAVILNQIETRRCK